VYRPLSSPRLNKQSHDLRTINARLAFHRNFPTTSVHVSRISNFRATYHDLWFFWAREFLSRIVPPLVNFCLIPSRCPFFYYFGRRIIYSPLSHGFSNLIFQYHVVRALFLLKELYRRIPLREFSKISSANKHLIKQRMVRLCQPKSHIPLCLRILAWEINQGETTRLISLKGLMQWRPRKHLSKHINIVNL
jgi:hypothetical protein